MVLKRIHRGLQFTQSQWLAEYININTALRQATKNTAESNMCKLMNNSVFGKTMENVKKRVDVTLCTNQKRYEKLVRDPMYVRRIHFCDDEANDNVLIAVLRQRKAITLDKPMAVGFTVLELSKLTMYDYHYKHMMPLYGPDRAQLCFTDTDSLLYEVQTDDVYADMNKNPQLYDFSGYPRDHACYNSANKNVPGKMKNETFGRPPHEFIGVKSKMYSLMVHEEKEKKVAKGVKEYVKDQTLRHQDYRNVLDNGVLMRHSMNTMRSTNHDVHSVTLVKITLSAYDDKRWLHADGINSYAYGHFAIDLEGMIDLP